MLRAGWLCGALPALGFSLSEWSEGKHHEEEDEIWMNMLLEDEQANDAEFLGANVHLLLSSDLPVTETREDEDGTSKTVTSFFDPGSGGRLEKDHADWHMKWVNQAAAFQNRDTRYHGLFGSNRFTAPPVFRLPSTQIEADFMMEDEAFWADITKKKDYLAELAAPLVMEFPELAFEAALRCVYGESWAEAGLPANLDPIPSLAVQASDKRCYAVLGDLIYAGAPHRIRAVDPMPNWVSAMAWWTYGGFQGDAEAMFSAASFIETGFEALASLFPLNREQWQDEKVLQFLTTLSEAPPPPETVRELMLNQTESLADIRKREAGTVQHILLSTAASLGHVGANLALGDRYHRGLHVRSSCRTAADYFMEGANQAHLAALHGLPAGRNSEWNLVSKTKPIQTFREIEHLEQVQSDKDDLQYASVLASRYVLGSHGFPQDLERGREYLLITIEIGRERLADLGEEASNHAEYKSIMNYLGRSYGMLGYLEIYGAFGPPSLDDATGYFKLSWNECSHPLGAIGIGLLLQLKVLDPKDEIRFPASPLKDDEGAKSDAYKLFKVASDAGYMDGHFSLAMLEMDEGNVVLAMELLAKAIDKGHTTAALALAMIHLRGIMINADCELGVGFLGRVARQQEWGLANQQRITGAWQRLSQYEELRDFDIYRPIGSLIDILFYEEHEEEPRVYPKVSKRLIGLHTSRLALAGYDDARWNLLGWMKSRYINVLDLEGMSDASGQRQAIARLSQRLLESMYERSATVYHDLGILYLVGLSPVAALKTEPINGIVDDRGESMDGWIFESKPAMVDRANPHEMTVSMRDTVQDLVTVSSKWRGHETAPSVLGRPNFMAPEGVEPLRWWDFSVARAHFRSARDAKQGATQRIKAKACFSMGSMALVGQGGPVDYKLALIHYQNMTIYDPTSMRVDFALRHMLIPLVKGLRTIGDFTLRRQYLKALLIAVCGFLLYGTVDWAETALSQLLGVNIAKKESLSQQEESDEPPTPIVTRYEEESD